MNNIIIGSILIIASLFGFVYWWWDVILLLKGLIPLVFLFVGIVAVFAGLECRTGKETTATDKAK